MLLLFTYLITLTVLTLTYFGCGCCLVPENWDFGSWTLGLLGVFGLLLLVLIAMRFFCQILDSYMNLIARFHRVSFRILLRGNVTVTSRSNIFTRPNLIIQNIIAGVVLLCLTGLPSSSLSIRRRLVLHLHDLFLSTIVVIHGCLVSFVRLPSLPEPSVVQQLPGSRPLLVVNLEAEAQEIIEIL